MHGPQDVRNIQYFIELATDKIISICYQFNSDYSRYVIFIHFLSFYFKSIMLQNKIAVEDSKCPVKRECVKVTLLVYLLDFFSKSLCLNN